MSGSKVIRRFAAAFVVTAAVAGAATLLQQGDSDSDSSPTSTRPTAPPSSVEPATTVVASTTSTVPEPVALRAPDAVGYCRTTYGDSSELESDTGAIGLRCTSVDGLDHPVDLLQACQGLVGPRSRPVLVDAESTDGWRCTPPTSRDTGPPDWDLACMETYGAEAIATRITDDSSGWRCANIVNGIFAVEEITIDAACQATVGAESFGEALSEDAGDVLCYVATS